MSMLRFGNHKISQESLSNVESSCLDNHIPSWYNLGHHCDEHRDVFSQVQIQGRK